MNASSIRRLLAIAAAVFGALALIAGSPYPEPAVDLQALAADIEHERDHVDGEELATWLRDGKRDLRVIDLREKANPPLSRSERTTISDLVAGKISVTRTDTIVLISDGGAHAAQAWVLLRAAGYQKVYFLRGGIRELNSASPRDQEIHAEEWRPEC